MSELASLSWYKLPIVGRPGLVCGHFMQAGAEDSVRSDFVDEFGECAEDPRWTAGMLLLCQEHARMVAEMCGDDILEIERAWREECL